MFVEKINSKFLTSVYQKPSFSDQYNRWDSFEPNNRKTNLLITILFITEELKLTQKKGPEKSPGYLSLPWIGNISKKFEKQSKTAIRSCFDPIKLYVVFFTRKMLLTVHKDVVPTKQQSIVVYRYVCRCDCQYVGRTCQRLQDRTQHHIPKAIRSQTQPDPDLS